MIITDKSHDKRLKELNINIETTFLDGDVKKKRNTNNVDNDDISNGIILNKRYFKNDLLLFEEKDFNPRITYSYIIKEELDKEYKCPNCGAVSPAKEVTDCCPYCRTTHNIDYTDKELSTRHHYDQILKGNTYKIITASIDLAICLIISFIYFAKTGRTFTIFDMLKATGFGLVAALILFYLFYYLDALIITLPVKMIKDKENNKKRKVWESLEKQNVSKKEFFNNLNYELEKYIYQKDNDIIDYDVLDYTNYEYFIDKEKRLNIKVGIDIRTIEYKDNKIVSNNSIKYYTLQRNEIEQDKLHEGINYIKCHKCGNGIDATKDHCEYCHTEVHYLQSWYIVNE